MPAPGTCKYILSARVPHGRGERPSSPPNAGPLASYFRAVEINPVLDLHPIEIDERDFNVHLKSIKSTLDKKETAMSLLRTCRKRAGCEIQTRAVSTIRKHFIGVGNLHRKEAKGAVMRRCDLLGWSYKDDNQADVNASLVL